MENGTHIPGETIVLMEDVTLTGQWLADGESSADIIWQDMDDADVLRADELELEIWTDEDPGHAYTRTVTRAEGWRAVLSGDVKNIVPVWERFDAEAEAGRVFSPGDMIVVTADTAVKARWQQNGTPKRNPRRSV